MRRPGEEFAPRAGVFELSECASTRTSARGENFPCSHGRFTFAARFHSGYATGMKTTTRTDLLGDITLIVKAIDAYNALDDEGRSAFAEFSLEVLEGKTAAVRKRGAKSIAEMLFPDK